MISDVRHLFFAFVFVFLTSVILSFYDFLAMLLEEGAALLFISYKTHKIALWQLSQKPLNSTSQKSQQH